MFIFDGITGYCENNRIDDKIENELQHLIKKKKKEEEEKKWNKNTKTEI